MLFHLAAAKAESAFHGKPFRSRRIVVERPRSFTDWPEGSKKPSSMALRKDAAAVRSTNWPRCAMTWLLELVKIRTKQAQLSEPSQNRLAAQK